MLKTVGQDVFKASLGHTFPKEIWDEVAAHLLRNPIIRRNLDIQYDLSDRGELSNDFLAVSTCWSYMLENLDTVRSIDYPVVAALDRCPDCKYRDRARFVAIEVDGRSLPEDVLRVDETSEAEIQMRTSVKLEPGQRKVVTLKGESVYPSENIIPFSLTDSTINIEVTVAHPIRIGVVIDPLHPREERLRKVPSANPSQTETWRIEGGLLSGHGVVIRWFQRLGA
ncbi:MAG: hypothetical protein AB1597_05900 [Chloroflexota bacterium]